MKIHGGDFITWISFAAGQPHPTGEDFLEALRTLASLAGVVLPERQPTAKELERAAKANRRADILEKFASYASKSLLTDEGKEVRAFLEGRGFSVDEASQVGLSTGLAWTQAGSTSSSSHSTAFRSRMITEGKWGSASPLLVRSPNDTKERLPQNPNRWKARVLSSLCHARTGIDARMNMRARFLHSAYHPAFRQCDGIRP